MQTFECKCSSRWPRVLIRGLLPGLVAAAALVIISPNASAGGKHPRHGHGQLPSGKETWGKPQLPRSGPHPDDTIFKSSQKK